jgi:uncharacterized membrane protein
MTLPKRIFLALVAVAVAQMLYFYQRLPEAVASHFDGAGHANGWSSKPELFGLMFGMIVMIGLVFLVMPMSFSRMPRKWISMPNRDYWLSGDRRAETIRFIDEQCSWFGVVTLLLILASLQFTIDANLRPLPELPARFMWVFWAYMGYTAVWTAHFVLHFARGREQHNAA